jgi:hypothetical protein
VFFQHEECDSDKSDLKMASYLRLYFVESN